MDPVSSPHDLTTAGWCFLIGSCAVMIIWTLWCYWLVLTTPQAAEHVHGTLDIEVRDEPT